MILGLAFVLCVVSGGEECHVIGDEVVCEVRSTKTLAYLRPERFQRASKLLLRGPFSRITCDKVSGFRELRLDMEKASKVACRLSKCAISVYPICVPDKPRKTLKTTPTTVQITSTTKPTLKTAKKRRRDSRKTTTRRP